MALEFPFPTPYLVRESERGAREWEAVALCSRFSSSLGIPFLEIWHYSKFNSLERWGHVQSQTGHLRPQHRFFQCECILANLPSSSCSLSSLQAALLCFFYFHLSPSVLLSPHEICCSCMSRSLSNQYMCFTNK